MIAVTSGLFLPATNANADLITPGPIFIGGVLLTIAGFVIGIIVLICWLAIRIIRKKKDDAHK
jgi:UPF0716 family protein affecting phage T7 exclusion